VVDRYLSECTLCHRHNCKLAANPSTRLNTLLARFELNFNHPADMRPDLAGRPVYLAMAMDADGALKLKPQNLLLNLPLRRA
jgi:hypothetical protein